MNRNKIPRQECHQRTEKFERTEGKHDPLQNRGWNEEKYRLKIQVVSVIVNNEIGTGILNEYPKENVLTSREWVGTIRLKLLVMKILYVVISIFIVKVEN